VNGAYIFNYTWCSDVNLYEMIDNWGEKQDKKYGKGPYASAKKTFANLSRRMEEEAKQFMLGGEFDPANWAPTFPRRVDELFGSFKKVVVMALADKLPAVLIAIICEYWIH
jgi:hypothetical protein